MKLFSRQHTRDLKHTKKESSHQTKLSGPQISSFYAIDPESKDNPEKLIFTYQDAQPLKISFNLTVFNVRLNEPVFVTLTIQKIGKTASIKKVEGYLNNLKLLPQDKVTSQTYISKSVISVTDLPALEDNYCATITIQSQLNDNVDHQRTYFRLKKVKQDVQEK